MRINNTKPQKTETRKRIGAGDRAALVVGDLQRLAHCVQHQVRD